MNLENNKRTQYQFELWEECNSRCKFCYLGKANLYTPVEQKLENLQKTIDKISNYDLYKKINCLAYIGGEFFQGQLKNNLVKKKFIQLMQLTNMLLENDYISEVWISASLLLGDQKDLYDCLSVFSNLENIWILTSYDTIGRFHSKKLEQAWQSNLEKLRSYSNKLKINITSILTGDFIEKYLNDTLTIQEIAEKYNCKMFWKPPCSIDRQDDQHLSKKQINAIIPNFFPQRQKFLSFLFKYKAKENSSMYDKLFNIQYRSEYLEKFTKGFHISHRIKSNAQEETDQGCELLPCGHSSQYQIYSDSDACAICDKQMILQLI